MFISKKTILFQDLRGVKHFPGVAQLFPGWGVQMLISIETLITCYCSAAQTVFIMELADLIYKVLVK